MRLAALLLFLIAGCHYLYDPLATMYAEQKSAARAIFYILRGIEGTALFAIIATLSKRTVITVVCAFGMFEESQTAICRASSPVGIGGGTPYTAFEGLCGVGWYSVGLVAAIVAGLWLLDKHKAGRPE